MTAKIILFDVDGVLVDSLDSHLRICQHLNTAYGLGLQIPTRSEFRSLARTGTRISPMPEFFTAVGFPSNRIDDADRYYQKHFSRDFPSGVFRGIPEVLKHLHDAGARLGIVTSNIRENVASALGSSWKLFDSHFCFTFDDVRKMTKSQALAFTAKELEIDPSEILYVGDQHSDQQAAANAGTAFLGVTWGWAIGKGDSGIRTVDTPEELGDCVMSVLPKKTNDATELLKIALDHSRSMFIYHAGQRHSSLNFYFAVLGAFVAGFVSLFTADKLWANMHPVAPIIITIVGAAAFRVTILFARLDRRNADLVEWDEMLMARVEKDLHVRNPDLPGFEIVRHSDFPPPKTVEREPGVAENYAKYKYRTVVRGALLVFKIIYALAIVGSWVFWFRKS
jgi:phosphoglycolate phosphatase